jgi:acetoacetyl-CoA reductase
MSRVGIVAGGTRGIGVAISTMLKDNGYTVAATYTGNDKAAAVFSKANSINVYRFDVGDFNACETSIARITADLGPIEVLVNNAGITRDGTMYLIERNRWDAVINTNLGSLI